MGYNSHLMPRYSHSIHSDDHDTSGWNGWLYPVLFIVLPIVACLMVLALIACNVYEYYQKKHRLEQYRHNLHHNPPQLIDKIAENPSEIGSDFDGSNGFNGYNESQYTYNTIFGNYVNNEANIAPVKPIGWVTPNM